MAMVGFALGAKSARAAVPAEEIPSRVSLEEAERIFFARGLDVLVAEYGAEGAQGDVQSAEAHPNPGLDLGAMYAPSAKHDLLYSGIQTSSVWGLNIGLTDNGAIEEMLSGKRSIRIEAASKALVSARFTVEEVKRLGVGALRQAYVTAVMARLNVDAAKESFQTYDEQLKLNKKRYDEGAISGLDLSRVTQAQLEALQTIDQAVSGERQAVATLLFLLGVRGAAPEVVLTSGIDYGTLPKLQEASEASLNTQALTNRTDVKVATANLEQAQALVKQAKRARMPNLALSLGYSELCSGSSCSSQPALNAGVQGNVPVLYQQQGEIARAESNERIAERSAEKVKAQLLSDVTQAFAGYVAAKSQVERMESRLLEQAKLSRDLAQHMYQRGAASFIDFMDAQRAYVASRLEYHQDLANYWTAIYQLEQATATSLR
jgi:outer membrane protein, heavy metal efflux system